jgi:transposase
LKVQGPVRGQAAEGHVDVETGRCDALVDEVDGESDGNVPADGGPDLESVRAETVDRGQLHVVHRPVVIDKVRDIVALYLNPPERAVVICVDEKSAVQALDRTQPVLPLLPHTPQRHTHDYVRHGTIDLFEALNLTSGVVIHKLMARHRAVEFRTFLDLIDRTVPAGLTVHVVLDNSSTHKTPAIQRWLVRHPRFEFHFTPTSSSWMNLVER